MLPVDFHRFKVLMNGMAKLYERELDDLVLDAYWVALRPWALEAFEGACGQLMRSSKFMPKPADFEELRQKVCRDTAGDVWARVREYARRYPPLFERDRCEFDGPTMRAVRALGGFQSIAMTHTDQMPFLERRFCEHYSAMLESDEAREALPQLDSRRLEGPQPLGNLLGRDQ